MRRIRKAVIKNWIPLTIGFCLTAVAVKSIWMAGYVSGKRMVGFAIRCFVF